MTNIDQFESVFKSADKAQFVLEPVTIGRVLVATDLNENQSQEFTQHVRTFLGVLGEGNVTWENLPGDRSSHVGSLLRHVEAKQPDLICTYRNLHMPSVEYPFSLGVHLDVLTQASSVPVLVMPRPEMLATEGVTENTNCVMAITDHLTGDHRLVSYAARLTLPNGTLWLTHVEDRATLERYIGTISRIPAIDTDAARQTIPEQLLKEPHDYIQSCRDVLQSAGLPLKVQTVVQLGHHLAEHRRLIDEHRVDLLVLHTKDDDQLAMHGLAYPLTVELRRMPMLLL